MNRARFASCIATLLAFVMLAGCAKNEVASTAAEPTTDDAAAEPASDTSETTADAAAEDSGAASDEPASDTEAAPEN